MLAMEPPLCIAMRRTEMDDAQPQLRWWIALQGAKQKTLSSDGLGELFGADSFEWQPPQELCKDAAPVVLRFEQLSAFSVRGVFKQVPELQRLLDAADALDDASATEEHLSELLPAGPLLTELLAMVPKERAVAPSRSPEPAAAAVSAFIKATSRTPGRKKRSRQTRQLRDRLEAAVYAGAQSALDAAQGIEGPWRGMDLLFRQSPEKASIAIEVVPLDLDVLPGLLDAAAEDERSPDALFVPRPQSPVACLRLADIGEQHLMPVIAAIDETPHELAECLADETADSPWRGLQQDERSRWLSVVVNRLVLAHEGRGSAARECLASGVWGVAAALSKSFAATGGFAKTAGPESALKMPVARLHREGRHEGVASPTEHFAPLRLQTELSKQGVICVGSVRDRASLVVAGLPCLRVSENTAPLGAQIITGRVVRFARWVREQLPTPIDEMTLHSVFVDAARVFLFPGLGEAGEVKAALTEDKQSIQVSAKVHASIAGAPVDVSFALPV